MRIDRVQLRLVRLPLVQFFETSFARIHDREFIVVTVHGDGAHGYGECVTDRDPYYSAETSDTAWRMLTDYLAPRVLGVEFAHPREVYAAFAQIRGHNMAKAALEMAAWDLHARQASQPLCQVLGGARTSIASGVSVGIQDSLEQLGDKIAGELAAGYQRVKVKIKPGWDVEAVASIRKRFGAVPLMVDANAAYTLADTEHLAELDAFDLMMIEQPLHYDDVHDHAQLQQRLRTPICLDESIHTLHTAREAIAVGACRIINVKPGRIGGHAQSIALHDLCAEHGLPVWHGGMLESGIGRTHNIHLSSLPNFTLPGDVAASKRYFEPDLIDPPVELQPDGTIAVPTGPGLGVTVVEDRVDAATHRAVTLKPLL
ncbi:MAG: o-succinylbenzoate synthase [Vicinamibacterales bacterium]|jgi:O-succinylbenzoate synthase|nr:o-succinylbenzoate synthase [Acidobacteriota bacterium]MDP6372468.1 o-succinylbenzoate synthase [Vicinamibacterales bacterium]MDP6608909.1 o-succinylbenzoate synthase [Vicinamibacterales bacterium]HAK54260.1 o-succinylbenzoate synthase [Acidobacteriota bacterium]|tara:strand:- start:1387 stop:2502 length:1116 start_codon:yes stop_codon:yes gene_type:complete